MKSILYIVLLVLLTSFTLGRNSVEYRKKSPISLDTLRLFDQSRQREIPIAIYKRKTDKEFKNQQIVIVSHGYNENRSGSYLGYTYLTEYLAANGFFVVSIQHELPTDSLIPQSGIPQIVRRPFWERGADNISFVIQELKKSNPNLNFNRITLIGHSIGGDMTALFPQKYPNIVDKIITLDNRRMALPRTNTPRVYSLRSSDQVADEGVLPTEEEMKKFDITIIKLPNTLHNDMGDNATKKQGKEINTYVLKFLTN
ncbi:MAG: alpha/beta hydrolase [Bacteroidetes bacterium B1(2017)]|nr:MAG: alpha/beta hydrolase [Bacteroidetes bacterium B1(2017)]